MLTILDLVAGSQYVRIDFRCCMGSRWTCWALEWAEADSYRKDQFGGALKGRFIFLGVKIMIILC